MNHDISYETVNDGDDNHILHWAFCSCGRWESTRKLHHWMVEDEARAHIDATHRAAAALTRRAVGLPATGRYYRQMAGKEGLTAQERREWEVLAEEIEARLASKTMSDDDQLHLF